MTTTSPDLAHLLDGTFASTRAAVALVRSEHLGLPTPCTEWTVADLLHHTVGVIEGFRSTAAKRVADADESRAFGDRLGPALADDPLAAYDRSATATLAAWRTAGAFDGETPLPVGFSVPAGAAAGINVVDTLVHGWDLRVALGAERELDPELAAQALMLARAIVTDEVRALVGFHPEVATGDDASPTARLVAFLGRQP